MIKKWLLYMACIILTLFLSIMYYEPFPVLCLLMILIVPIVGALIQLPLIWFVKVEFSAFDVVCEMGDESKVQFLVKNRSYIPIWSLRIHIKIENELSGQIQKKYIDMRVPAHDNIIVPLYISSEDCGRIRLNLEKVQIMGLIPIYCISLSKRKTKKEVYMTVLPRMKNLSMTVSRDTRNYSVDWELIKIRKEDNQIYKIRPFQASDRLQRIHWKLSAKNDEWMIREIISTDGANVLLIMDWKNKTFETLNRTMEAVVSLAFGLTMESCNAVIASSTNVGEWYPLTCEEDLYLVFGEIMQQKLLRFSDKHKKGNTETQLPFITMLEQRCVGVTFPHIFYVTDKAQKDIVTLLGTSNIARKKTFVYTGDDNFKPLETLLQQHRIEYFCIEKGKEDSILQWDLLV